MTRVNWKDNKHSGIFVTRQLMALEPIIEKAKGPRKMVYLSRYVYLWQTKAMIAKTEKDNELEERIKKLERAAGLAQQTPPVTA